MLMTTTTALEGKPVSRYLGVVTGEAIIGIDLDYEVLGQSNGMLMVSVSGTAVVC